MCTGPSGSKDLLKAGANCDEAKCPNGYKCANGMRGPECCKTDEIGWFLKTNFYIFKTGSTITIVVGYAVLEAQSSEIYI